MTVYHSTLASSHLITAQHRYLSYCTKLANYTLYFRFTALDTYPLMTAYIHCNNWPVCTEHLEWFSKMHSVAVCLNGTSGLWTTFKLTNNSDHEAIWERINTSHHIQMRRNISRAYNVIVGLIAVDKASTTAYENCVDCPTE
jgi:hypothetical protein